MNEMYTAYDKELRNVKQKTHIKPCGNGWFCSAFIQKICIDVSFRKFGKKSPFDTTCIVMPSEVQIMSSAYIPSHSACSTEETIIQNFLQIQNPY